MTKKLDSKFVWKLEPKWIRLMDSLSAPVTSPAEIAPIIRHIVSERPNQESTYVLLLDISNSVVGVYQATIGLRSKAQIDMVEVFRPAILIGASAIIFAHNHPSGRTKPSEQDLMVTRTMVEAGKLLDIVVIDSIIVTLDSFSSIRALKPQIFE